MRRTCAVIVAVLISNSAFSTEKGVAPVLSFVLDESCADVPTVTSPGGRVWMDRNLGAAQVALSKTDTAAYGDLYQWGRLADGHQERISGTDNAQSLGPVPGHAGFIISHYDWINPSKDTLWQGVNGINNPCPPCFRLATRAEWNAEISELGITDRDSAFNSLLKLVVAGSRSRNDGGFDGVDSHGYYWSSDIAAATGAYYFGFDSFAGESNFYRAYGMSVRCIKQ